jgi:hypothetical protein
MALTLDDIEELADENNLRDPISVGMIPTEVAELLGIKSHAVYLSCSSLNHIQQSHPDIDYFKLLHLPLAIERGLLVQEIARPYILLSSYKVPNEDIRYVTALKILKAGTEIWVSSFYRVKARQTKSILRRSRILQKHK